jgi:hypothetical protein
MSKAKQQPAQFSFGLIVTDPEQYRIVSMHRSRRCLCCDRQFASTGPGHRICGPCKDLDIWSSPVEFSVSAAF